MVDKRRSPRLWLQPSAQEQCLSMLARFFSQRPCSWLKQAQAPRASKQLGYLLNALMEYLNERLRMPRVLRTVQNGYVVVRDIPHPVTDNQIGEPSFPEIVSSSLCTVASRGTGVAVDSRHFEGAAFHSILLARRHNLCVKNDFVDKKALYCRSEKEAPDIIRFLLDSPKTTMAVSLAAHEKYLAHHSPEMRVLWLVDPPT